MFTKLTCLIALAFTVIACDAPNGGSITIEDEHEDRAYLSQFNSEEDINEWVTRHGEESRFGGGVDAGLFDEVSETSADTPQDESSGGSEPTNENITNNQEADVDEGGIVKNIGDFLVILRRGHLFSVKVSESSESELVDSIAVARDQMLKNDVWYDELLVKGDQIVALGYRYLYIEDSNVYGSTEINTFTLNSDGVFQREASHWLESYDYYSSNNSASRLVNGNLVLYMPHAFFEAVYPESFDGTYDDRQEISYHPSYPRKLNYEGDGQFTIGERLVDPRRISYIDGESGSILHNIVNCPLLTLADEGSLDCQGHAVLSQSTEEIYVSSSHAYLKISDQVFALSLGEESKVKRHRLEGQVSDQFSFKQLNDSLWVSVAWEDNQGMDVADQDPDTPVAVEPFSSEQKFMLVELPLADFNGQGDQEFTLLNKITFAESENWDLWMNKQRFFRGTQYIAAMNRGYELDSTELKVVDIQAGTVQDLELPGNLTRLELMGAIGTFMALHSEDGLQVATAINLETQAEIVLGETFNNQSEGESRSHGFYFKPDETGGRLGLPVINGQQFDWLNQSSAIAFFRVNQAGEIIKWGEATSGDQSELSCSSSCVDWYGNTRPLFLKNRVYALMGGEVSEYLVNDGEVDLIGSRVLLNE